MDAPVTAQDDFLFDDYVYLALELTVLRELPDTMLVDVIGNPDFPPSYRQGAANLVLGREIKEQLLWQSRFLFSNTPALGLRSLVTLRSAEDPVFALFIQNATPIQ